MPRNKKSLIRIFANNNLTPTFTIKNILEIFFFLLFQETVLSGDVRLILKDFKGKDKQQKKIEVATQLR